MKGFLIFGLILLVPISVKGEDDDAKSFAQGILDKGALLFAKKDAEAMTRTYTPGARIEIISKDKDSQEYKFDIREGRSAIHELYADLYKNANEEIRARNTVEFARRLAPDLLVIHGVFEPMVGKENAYSFVQIRKREGDKWLIANLQLFLLEEE